MSERAGFTLASLPNGGYDGQPPAFPLERYRVNGPDGPDEKAMRSFRKRELALWRQLWKSPQAWAWSMPQYSYLCWDIAMYCRLMVLAGESTATAADRGLIPRYADRIGLSAAGLAALGWQITPDEMAKSMKRLERRTCAVNHRTGDAFLFWDSATTTCA
ncbi:hypothetical protein [Bifidobacterium saguinibicoloris]|uniref:hypothetical protein n=1 Tax=Bifidobacterium saguinibicoloris TaxID=2834433 RepID=UPI001C588C21|nr:hypothetical protein [Bifidobacterium saguinibicoloris]MBW3079873.1 hypothetical protein [Bifidobacterium saguinibicoloris]